jgi:hypothetical protein
MAHVSKRGPKSKRKDGSCHGFEWDTDLYAWRKISSGRTGGRNCIYSCSRDKYVFLFVILFGQPPSLNIEHIENPKPDLNAVMPNERTAQPALKSSAGPSTQQQPQYPTSPSSDTFAARSTSPFQNSASEEVGRTASPPITCERNPSPNGLPSQPTSVNGKTRRVPENDENRVVELERQLSATLAAKTERDERLAQLIEELALKSALLEQAEANAAEATKRAGLEPRELADRLLAQTSLVERLVNMQAKLDESVLSRDQAQSALQKAISRAAVADERSQRACEQNRQYETELAEVRAELKAGKS